MPNTCKITNTGGVSTPDVTCTTLNTSGMTLNNNGFKSTVNTTALTANHTVSVPNADVNLANVPNQAVNTTSTPQFSTANITTAGGLTVGGKTPSDTQLGYVTAMNQGVSTSSAPQFAKLGIGKAAGTEALEVSGNMKTSGNGNCFISNAGNYQGIYETPHFLLCNGDAVRYRLSLGHEEKKDDTGSDIILTAHYDNGSYRSTLLTITRSTGDSFFGGKVIASNINGSIGVTAPPSATNKVTIKPTINPDTVEISWFSSINNKTYAIELQGTEVAEI